MTKINKKAIPFDRLPLAGGYFNQPNAVSPYNTERAEHTRTVTQSALLETTLKTATESLSGVTKPKAHKGIFEHNVITLASALAYANSGLSVVDLHGMTERSEQTGAAKSCKIPRGPVWQHRASNDAESVIDFWTGNGTCPPNKDGVEYPFSSANAPRNVGIVVSSGMFILDIDGVDGRDSLKALEATHGALPKTYKVLTGSGGLHYYFRCAGDADIRNSASQIGKNIDIRGAGGFCVSPPSIHPTGNFYAWGKDCAPWETELADAPQWLVDAAYNATKSRQTNTEDRVSGRRVRGSQVYVFDGVGIGFDARLECIGDDADGFDAPILAAANSYFFQHGANADSGELFDILRDTITNAEREGDRSRYDTDDYLENRIEQARHYVAEQQDSDENLEQEIEVNKHVDEIYGDLAFDLSDLGDLIDVDKTTTPTKRVTISEFEPVKDWLPKRYKVNGDDIWTTGDDKTPICQKFDVVGRSSGATGEDSAGRIISFVNENKIRVELTLTRGDIATDSRVVMRGLVDAGMRIFGRSKSAQERLLDLLDQITPKRWIRTVNVPGWVRNNIGDIIGFMLPTGEYMPVQKNGDPMRLHESVQLEVIKPKGCLDDWKTAANEALTYSDSNFYWPLGLVSAFGGPLLGILEWQPVGFSLSGMTSKGKTMSQIMASSVYGSTDAGRGVLFTTNTTGNAIEDLAIRGTETYLALDELGAMTDKKALSSVIMALSTGRTKARKSGRGLGLAESANFRPFVVFSSETGLKNEINSVGEMYRGGLAVRFPDIDVTNGENISAKNLEKLDAFKHNYGHAGHVFIQHLIDSGVTNDRVELERSVLEIADKIYTGNNSAMRRAARVFALAQKGGELAVDAGLLDDADAIREACSLAWGVYINSDEAGAAKGGDSILDDLRSFLNGAWDRTIIAAGGVSSDGTGLGSENDAAKGTPIGWYDDETIYLDWKQIERPSDLGMSIGKRGELVKALKTISALDSRSLNDTPYTSIPVSLAATSDGGERKVKNLRIRRRILGI